MKKKYIVSEFDDGAILAQKEMWDKLDSKAKGMISENYVVNKLAELNYDVWCPAMNNHRCDLGIFLTGKIIRIQVKTGAYDSKTKRFRTMLQTRDKEKNHIAYKRGELDFFIVYCPFVHEFYVIPSNVGIKNHAVNMLPHRERAIAKSGNNEGWELYKNAFYLLEA